VGAGWERYMCTLYVKHVPSLSVRCEYHKAIYLFQLTPCSACGTILFSTKLICSKCVRRLVSVRGFYIRWRIHCIWNHTQKLSGFPYGRTQHVRRMCSSSISVIHYLSMWYFVSCHVTKDGSYFLGSANCPFSLQK